MAPRDHASDDINRSRRRFLKSTGVVGVAASVIAPAGADAQAGPAALGPGAVPVTLHVNGRRLDLMLEPRVTLLDALMCGFCTPGFVMASVGLLEQHPNATPEQIRKGLDGNICRCGTFPRIFEAVSSVAGGRRG